MRESSRTTAKQGKYLYIQPSVHYCRLVTYCFQQKKDIHSQEFHIGLASMAFIQIIN